MYSPLFAQNIFPLSETSYTLIKHMHETLSSGIVSGKYQIWGITLILMSAHKSISLETYM